MTLPAWVAVFALVVLAVCAVHIYRTAPAPTEPEEN